MMPNRNGQAFTSVIWWFLHTKGIYQGFKDKKKGTRISPKPLFLLVGARGFEPPTPATPLQCATRLRHAPTFFYSLPNTCRHLERDARVYPICGFRSRPRRRILQQMLCSRHTLVTAERVFMAAFRQPQCTRRFKSSNIYFDKLVVR